MAKRRLLQWMRDRLTTHTDKIVIPIKEKKALEAAYKKAEPLVLAAVAKRYPIADMKVLTKYECAEQDDAVKVQFPNGIVTEFAFDEGRGPFTPEGSRYGRIYLTDTPTAHAVDRWEAMRGEYTEERKKRLEAYRALIAGASYVEDITGVWPEVKDILPAGSLPIPLGLEQIALVKADMKERRAS